MKTKWVSKICSAWVSLRYEFLLSEISDLISANERISGNRPVLTDKILALTLRYLATVESFQSHNYLSCIVKGCFSVVLGIVAWNSRKFEQRWNSPHALGAIYGKHVRIIKPSYGGLFFFTTKVHSFNHNFRYSRSRIQMPFCRC